MKKHALPISTTFPPAGIFTPPEGLRFLHDHGFDSMDFNFVAALDRYGRNWQDMIEVVKRDADETGMLIVSGHLPFRGKTPEELDEKIKACIEMGAALGIKRAVMPPVGDGKMPAGEENHDYWYAKNIEFYNQYIPLADKAGFKLVTENMRDAHQAEGCHRYGSTADELIEIADPLGLEICWDFGHAHIDGVEQSEGIKYVGKRLKVLHVNDNFATEDEHLPPFIGNIDWRDAMHGLSEVGFDGLLNFELSTGRLPKGAREAYASLIIESANALMSYIE